MAVSFAGRLLIQRIILRPVEKAPVLTNVIVFIGLLLIFNALSGWIFDHTVKAFASPFPQELRAQDGRTSRRTSSARSW